MVQQFIQKCDHPHVSPVRVLEVGSIQHCRRWRTTGLQATWTVSFVVVVFQCESAGFFPFRTTDSYYTKSPLNRKMLQSF